MPKYFCAELWICATLTLHVTDWIQSNFHAAKDLAG
jgi:hypothetical protein